MAKQYRFSCGCSFPIISEPKGYSMPLLDFSYEDINWHCTAVYDMAGKAISLGCFQLESNLGKKYLKELQPKSIEHFSALGAALRPGTLQSEDEKGKNLCQKYCDRANGREPVDIEFPAINHILADTYGILLYQEQQISIAQEVCGFSPSKADELRRGVGKKKMDVILSLQKEFIDGADKVGKITKDNAIKIFDWIKSAARYSFNRSHSTLYGIRTYVDFYLKSHFPLQFYTAKLKSPRKSTDDEDIANLIYEMKSQGIHAKLPDVRDMRPLFYNDGKHIYFGLVDIKHYGESAFNSLSEVYQENKNITTDFFEFALNSALKLPESKTILLIEAGALDWTGLSRSQMLEEFKLLSQLTKGEKEKLGKYLQAKKEGVFNA